MYCSTQSLSLQWMHLLFLFNFIDFTLFNIFFIIFNNESKIKALIIKKLIKKQRRHQKNYLKFKRLLNTMEILPLSILRWDDILTHITITHFFQLNILIKALSNRNKRHVKRKIHNLGISFRKKKNKFYALVNWIKFLCCWRCDYIIKWYKKKIKIEIKSISYSNAQNYFPFSLKMHLSCTRNVIRNVLFYLSCKFLGVTKIFLSSHEW